MRLFGDMSDRNRLAPREGNARDQQDQGAVPDRPELALFTQRKDGLDEERIGKQAAEASEVAGSIKRIGIARPVSCGVPALHQRCLCRNGEEYRAHGQEEEPWHPDDFPARSRSAACLQGKRQGQAGEDEQGDVDHRLALDRKPADEVRVSVSAEKQRLVNQHRAVPDIGRAAEPGQCHARDHRLDHEQQETAHEDRESEQPAARSCAPRLSH